MWAAGGSTFEDCSCPLLPSDCALPVTVGAVLLLECLPQRGTLFGNHIALLCCCFALADLLDEVPATARTQGTYAAVSGRWQQQRVGRRPSPLPVASAIPGRRGPDVPWPQQAGCRAALARVCRPPFDRRCTAWTPRSLRLPVPRQASWSGRQPASPADHPAVRRAGPTHLSRSVILPACC